MSEIWAKKFYDSPRWKKFREVIISERGLRCERCGKLMLSPSLLQLDHVTPLNPDNINDPDIALARNNVQLLCNACHNIKHGRYENFMPKNTSKNTSKNNPYFLPKIERKVTIVYGPPLSGKTFYVNHVKNSDDLVCDINYIWQSLTGDPNNNKPSPLKAVVFGVRDAILDAIYVRSGYWTQAWVVGGYPKAYQREDLAHRLKADCKFIDTPIDVCIMRANNDKSYIKYIQKWFDDFMEFN